MNGTAGISSFGALWTNARAIGRSAMMPIACVQASPVKAYLRHVHIKLRHVHAEIRFITLQQRLGFRIAAAEVFFPEISPILVHDFDSPSCLVSEQPILASFI